METPILSATSPMCRRYEGVEAMTVTFRSRMRSICLSVFPVEAGTTAAPTFSAP